MRISDFIPAGSENAVRRLELVALTGLDERTVRAMIARERKQGIPILSDNQNGYFMPGNEAERSRCVASLRHRAGEISAAADAIERSGGG